MANKTLIGQDLTNVFANEEYAKMALSNAFNDLIICQFVTNVNSYKSQSNDNYLTSLFYRINLNSITQLLYNQEIVDNISMLIGNAPAAKTVLSALIANNVPMTPNQVHNYISNCPNNNITLDYTKRILSGLSRHPDGMVVLTSGDEYAPEPKYMINSKRSRDIMLKRILFGCIEQSCGVKGARIWNLLIIDNQFWNPQSVSQQALMSLSTVRSLLYSLSLKGYARIHELANLKSNSTENMNSVSVTSIPCVGNKQTQSLHFTSNFALSANKIIQDCYKIATNILYRLEVNELNGKIYQVNLSDTSIYSQNNVDLLELSLLNVFKLLFLLDNSM